MRQAFSRGLQLKRRAVAASLVCFFKQTTGVIQSEVVRIVCNEFYSTAAPERSDAEEVMLEIDFTGFAGAAQETENQTVSVPFQYGNATVEQVCFVYQPDCVLVSHIRNSVRLVCGCVCVWLGVSV